MVLVYAITDLSYYWLVLLIGIIKSCLCIP